MPYRHSVKALLSLVAIAFVDVTQQAGVLFHHHNGSSSEKYLVETMGSGAALLDFDQDGLLDIFFVDGGATQASRHALFRSKGDGKFEDVAAKAGVATASFHGMGVAAGDFNNDGYPDLYVTGFNASTLYRSRGGKSFEDATRRAGVGNSGRWATSAAWFDFNNDGYLDLIVANYLKYDYARNLYCGERKPGFRMYCHPNNFEGVAPTLYRNNQNGTFTDITAQAGLDRELAKGLGVVAADFDNDGWMDLFIANDSVRNLLYRNKGNGTFEDVTLTSGTGYTEDGVAEAGMGVDAGDYNRDGLLDIYITHLDFELNRLYQNRGNMQFADVTMVSGLGRTAVLNSGFGTKFLDYDADGWQDLLVVNGHVLDNVSMYRPDVQYAERKMLYRNHRGRFQDVTAAAGPAFVNASVGRGLAVGDYDNDGDVDFVVSNNGQAAQLVRGEKPAGNHWIELLLVGVQSNRDAAGARLEVSCAGDTQYAQRTGGGSYLSSSDPRIYFGLGSCDKIDRLEIRWPSGKIDVLRNLAVDRITTVKEGGPER